jgi:hypothetical protein
LNWGWRHSSEAALLQPHYNRLSRWPAYAGLPIDITAANIEGFADCLYVDRSNA